MFKEIKFGPVYSNLDDTQHPEGVMAVSMNAYVDEMGDHVKRDGLTFWTAKDSSKIDGIYETKSVNAGTVLVATGGYVCKMAADKSFTTLTGAYEERGKQVVWAEDFNFVFITAGEQVYKLDLTNNTCNVVSGNSPTKASHIVWVQSYLLTNGKDSSEAGNPGDIHYSDDVADAYALSDSWEVFNNESNPDSSIALHSDWEEIFSIGPYSTEARYNDGTTPWGRLEGTYSGWGTLSGDSAKIIGGNLYFLTSRDSAVKVAKVEERAPTVISWPYDDLVRGFSTHTDAIGLGVVMKGRPFYVITWPTEDVTLAYTIEQDTWSQWSFRSGSDDLRWLGNCYCFSRSQGKHFVGDRRANGRIYTLSGTQDDSSSIRMQLTSGFINHGTNLSKFNNYLKIKTNSPLGYTLEYRDDGTGSFVNSRTVVPASGEFMKKENSWGEYTQRQWQVTHTANEAFVMSSFWEDFEEGTH